VKDHFRKLENMYHSAPVNQFYSPRLRVAQGNSTLTMEVREEFFHAAGALHGSVYFKAPDDAAFFAVNSLVPGHFVVTVSLNIYLLRPVQSGTDDRVVARGSGSFMRSRVPLNSIESYG
jgi:uncharacterized protein (TIGR00369 family)